MIDMYVFVYLYEMNLLKKIIFYLSMILNFFNFIVFLYYFYKSKVNLATFGIAMEFYSRNYSFKLHLVLLYLYVEMSYCIYILVSFYRFPLFEQFLF